MHETNVLITGGTGTLGTALVETLTRDTPDWRLTVFSRDYLKQAAMKKKYPQVRYVLGDICDYDSIYQAAIGHDIIIHAAAQKHIPAAEQDPLDAVRINVHGSQNVLTAAITAGVGILTAVSTDKVCQPTSIYGATKMFMERMFVKAAQELYMQGHDFLKITLCRYGNVLGSNGSVLQVWERQEAAGLPITLTDPTMTRFWLTERDAVELVLDAMDIPPGNILVPMAPASDMETLARAFYPGSDIEVIGRRPGEKANEQLLTAEEIDRCIEHQGAWVLTPHVCNEDYINERPFFGDAGYSSDNPARWLSTADIQAMVK